MADKQVEKDLKGCLGELLKFGKRERVGCVGLERKNWMKEREFEGFGVCFEMCHGYFWQVAERR